MSNLIILDYINIISNYNIYGIKSIQYISFFILIFKTDIFEKIIKTKELISTLHSSKENQIIDILDKTRKQINNIYGVFDFVFDDNPLMLIKLINFTINIDISNINIKDLIDDCFITHINNENLSVIKEYVKFYNNKKLISWIVSNTNIQQTDMILDINCKINSFYNEIRDRTLILKQKESLNNRLYGLQSNDVYKSLLLLDNLIKHGDTFSNNISSNDALINDISINGLGMYDFIFLDMPHGIHNVIHASCCQKIKKLKLRGTKAEPLLLQLVMSSLNKNGKGILIVPDSLLFSNSLQPVETREYLLNNFCIKKIIQIDESLYWGDKITRDLKSQSSTIKNSILIFENNEKTKSVEFSKIILKETKIIETKIIDVGYELFESTGYSFYYKNYLEMIKKSTDKIQFMCLNELFDVDTKIQIIESNKKILALAKNYKDESSIRIIDVNTNNTIVETYSYFIKEKQNNEIIANYPTSFLEFKINSDPEKYVKGKMSQFDINKIQDIKIPVISKEKQSAICTYINLSNEIINENNNKIKLCYESIMCIMETLPTDKMINLDKIANLYQSQEIKQNDIPNIIGIIKNGQGAGTVYIPKEQISNNSHYIVIKNPNEYLKKYIYEYLKYSEEKLKKTINLTLQPNLTKTFIMNFQIPEIDILNQDYLCSHCDIFNNSINSFINSNNEIKQKDIISTIIKTNGF
jgi:hypothetical protein